MVTEPNLDPPPQRLVRCKCAKCGGMDEFYLPKKGFHALSRGKKHQAAFPELDPVRLRELQEHICPRCQEAQ